MMEGRRLADRFLILKTIGAGGATEVSLAQDDQMGELVALRVLADRLEHGETIPELGELFVAA
ncbi:MAG: type II toxin-antitoxin system HicB family antitoxin [Myxococcales bacterium]|nr:type II toxin-antitoxin system HicB family antitoxin [Myxococcales bacterium]